MVVVVVGRGGVWIKVLNIFWSGGGHQNQDSRNPNQPKSRKCKQEKRRGQIFGHFVRTWYLNTPQKWLCNFTDITPQHGCSHINLLHNFRIPFHRDILEVTASRSWYFVWNVYSYMDWFLIFKIYVKNVELSERKLSISSIFYIELSS